MRQSAKPNSKSGGISAASAYRCGVKSAATDLEALIDAYGLEQLFFVGVQIRDEIAKHGDSYGNTTYNTYLNALPLPIIRKINNPEAKKRRRKVK